MKNLWKKRSSQLILMILVLCDIVIVNASSFLAMWFHFDFVYRNIPSIYLDSIFWYSAIHTITTVVLFAVFRLYTRIWRFVGINEFLDILGACLLSTAFQIIGMTLLQFPIPNGFFPINLIMMVFTTMLLRFSYRVLRMFFLHGKPVRSSRQSNVMLIGAGRAGATIINELKSNPYLKKRVVCVIDDNSNKKGKYFFGSMIVGDRTVILESVAKYKVDEIVIAIPSANRKAIKDLLDICNRTDCQLSILPGMYQLINGEVSISKLRKVDIEDLLGRDPVRVDLKKIMEYVAGKTVLVTGGGGSIGSELCRQLAAYHPARLIILDIYENNAYDIQQELKVAHPDLELEVLIGSVRDTKRLDAIFSKYRPNIVYHAAAHKHVPLMEDSPNEAVKNNVFGTYQTALAASKYHAERFVLISSDKAVNPTNVMGATKRISEMIIQSIDRSSETEFVAVRFGNVLGSNGSVIPLFKHQIEMGGPVTVTHPDIIRYFMTIPEAVALVLQAGSYANGGEIFILDMGEPIKIIDLAKNLIRLSGYRPNEDIEIIYTGLRPGEKLYEEMLMDEEGMRGTENKRIFIGKPIEMDEQHFYSQLEHLKNELYKESDSIVDSIKSMVSTYHEPKPAPEISMGIHKKM